MAATAGADNTVTEPSGTEANGWDGTLTNGSYYWLMWQWDNTSAGPSYADAGSGNQGICYVQSYGAFPSSWSGGVSTNEQWTEYVNYSDVPLPAAPTLASPSNNAVNQPADITLQVNPSSGATSYHWQVSVSPTFSSTAVDNSTSGTTNSVTLSGGTKYYWRVQAVSSAGASSYSPADSFTTVSAPGPGSPTLAYPANNATGLPTDKLVLKWNQRSPYTSYVCMLSTDPSFSTLVAQSAGTSGTTFEVTSLAGLTKYYWRVCGYGSGYASLSLTDSFKTAVGLPVLASPVDSAMNEPSNLTLEVNSVTKATGYLWEVSLDSSFSSTVVDDSTMGTNDTTEAVTLTNGRTYYWRVEALGSTGPSGYARIETFTTIGLPVLAWPGCNALNLPCNITLRINPVAGVSGYHWQISTSPTFGTVLIDDSTSGSGDTAVVVGLTAGHEYYWRVEAFDVNAVSPFTATDSFSVMSVPDVPLLAYPADNASYQPADTLTLEWHSVATDTGYVCEVSDSTSFSSLVVTQDTTRDTTMTVTSLKNLRKYYWRVCSYNAGGMSAFTAIDSFTTIIAAPSAPNPRYPIGTTGEPRIAAFKWEPSQNALRYRLQVAKSDSVDSLGGFMRAYVVFDTTLSDTTDTLSTPLQADVKYYWHVSAIDTGGAGAYSAVEEFTTGTGLTGVDEISEVPKEYRLFQNYPNPFNPTTVIGYQLPVNSRVTLRVYDILGREVATLVDGEQNAGSYKVTFNGARYASGVYFYRIVAEGTDGRQFVSIKKFVLMK